jgi:hypothetical protein
MSPTNDEVNLLRFQLASAYQLNQELEWNNKALKDQIAQFARERLIARMEISLLQEDRLQQIVKAEDVPHLAHQLVGPGYQGKYRQYYPVLT